MSDQLLHNLGDAIFGDIDENPFLNELYENILYNYAIMKFELTETKSLKEVDVSAALRFADLLSKSTHAEHKDQHKMWAQEIIVLLNALYPDDPNVRWYAGSVFSNTGNYQAQQLMQSDFDEASALDGIFTKFRNDYLTIPAAPEMRFFHAQKVAYDHLADPYFSYSGPTSMGKSFIMRMFIKEQIERGVRCNFALVVPTKALINEMRSQTIDDLKGLLKEHNYKVVTAAGDIALEGKHNFILVLTPERLLYLLISKPELNIDYLFIDEAHKLSGQNSRGPFYYKAVDMLLNRPKEPHFIFASPNIPNPEVYLRLLSDEIEFKENRLHSTFSPVAQIKFIIDLNGHAVSVYNDHTEELSTICSIKKQDATLTDFLYMFEHYNLEKPPEKRQQTIVYCNGRTKAIENALEFAKHLPDLNDDDLIALSKDISGEVHSDYFLAEIIKRGVAYHIGYLPSAIRMRLEDMFRKGKITTMFCTSTLLEGVNLPADNLFITDTKIFRRTMSPVDFRNLIGRVGRIRFNLYGNVFFVPQGDQVKEQDFVNLLKEEVPEQSLSIEAGPKGLTKAEKKHVVAALLEGNIEFEKRNNQSEESYVMMRKFALILLRDIMRDNDSLVRREFSSLLSSEDESHIRQTFTDPIAEPDDDINVSVDQTKNLTAAIAYGLKYPDRVNGHFVYDDVVMFLEKLAKVFKWKHYEYTSLGKTGPDGQLSLLRWYAVILVQWMEGTGLSSIMKKAIEYRQQHPDNFWINKYQKTIYNDTIEHRNIVFADTLEVIDNIVLFSISNYFLRFSNEYKRIHQVTEFENNWYEYVEYGTTNPLTILLQRNGFSRENSTYIKAHHENYIVELPDGTLRLNRSILQCSNLNVREEALSIQYNMPELFVQNDNEVY